jgi:hypothetical protein
MSTAPTRATARVPLSRGRRIMLVVGGFFAVAVIAFGTWSVINLLGQTTTERKLTLTPTAGRLSVDTEGDIRVEVGDVTDVQVTERLRYGTGRPRVEETSGPDGLRIRGHCSWYSSSCSVDVLLTVPATLSLDLHSSAGDVTVSGAGGGDLMVDSSAGDVRATGIRATRVVARSSAGDVRLGFAVPPSSVIAHSSAGDVEVRVPRVDGGYRVEANSSAGDRQVDVPTDPASARRIDVTSSAGDVKVLPEGAA